LKKTLLLLLCLSVPSAAAAQAGCHLGGAAAIYIPLPDDFSSRAEPGGGFVASSELSFKGSFLSLVATVGYTSWGAKKQKEYFYIPGSDPPYFEEYFVSYSYSALNVKLGCKLHLSQGEVRPYAQVEGGVVIFVGDTKTSPREPYTHTDAPEFIFTSALGTAITIFEDQSFVYSLDLAPSLDLFRFGRTTLSAGVYFSLGFRAGIILSFRQ